MDDDQAFVKEISDFIVRRDFVAYDAPVSVQFTDEGRNALIELQLFAGDRYRIAIEELH